MHILFCNPFILLLRATSKKKPIVSAQTGPHVFGSGFLQKDSKIFKFSTRKNDETKFAMPSVFDEQLDMITLDDAATAINNHVNNVMNTLDESPTVHAATIEQNEAKESSLPLENDSLPKQRGGRQSTKKGRGANSGVRRTQTMKDVAEDAKAILGENSNHADVKESSQWMNDECQGASICTRDTNNERRTRQKRQRALASEMSLETSEMYASEGEDRVHVVPTINEEPSRNTLL